MRFNDARAAGRALAARLGAYAGRESAVVLALARGGVAVGLGVSELLGLPLDILLLRRLLATRGPLHPLCAASVAGARFVDEEVAARASSSDGAAFRGFLASALAELDEQAHACRGARPPVELSGRTVLLVDNGIRTGSTALAAARALNSFGPARVVIAAPVAARESLGEVRPAADEFVCLSTPEPFGHVGLWYADFSRPADEEIRAMLEESEALRADRRARA
jgi:putative phosphoribosyl transferase